MKQKSKNAIIYRVFNLKLTTLVLISGITGSPASLKQCSLYKALILTHFPLFWTVFNLKDRVGPAPIQILFVNKLMGLA